MGQAEGLRAEEFFRSKLNATGIDYNYDDDWYDFRVNNQKVEVKSCRLFCHNWKKGTELYGRYKFTDKENSLKQVEEDIWLCFIMRYKDQHIFQGFCRAKALNGKGNIGIRTVQKQNLLTFDEWLAKVRKDG